MRSAARISSGPRIWTPGWKSSTCCSSKGGHWNPDDRPATWADPEAAFEQDAFWQVFDLCMNKLPEHIARVYTMRELLEFDTAEICAALGITPNNCFVILHRARLGLRECLENRWFRGESR